MRYLDEIDSRICVDTLRSMCRVRCASENRTGGDMAERQERRLSLAKVLGDSLSWVIRVEMKRI
jgi:hypothetical protein